MVAALGKNLSAEERKTLEASQSVMEIGYATAAVGMVREQARDRPQQ